jgi:hypothetical protein
MLGWTCMYVYMCEWSTVFSLPLRIQKCKRECVLCITQPSIKFGRAKTTYPVLLFYSLYALATLLNFLVSDKFLFRNYRICSLFWKEYISFVLEKYCKSRLFAQNSEVPFCFLLLLAKYEKFVFSYIPDLIAKSLILPLLPSSTCNRGHRSLFVCISWPGKQASQNTVINCNFKSTL